MSFDWEQFKSAGNDGDTSESSDTSGKKHMTEKEQQYLAQYKKQMSGMREPEEAEIAVMYDRAAQGDRDAVSSLTELWAKRIVPMAEEKWVYGVHIGDLIQEGNLAAFLALSSLGTRADAAGMDADAYVKEAVQKGMDDFRQQYIDQALEDSRVVDKLNKIGEAVKQLTEDFGDEFDANDIAAYTGMSVEEMQDLVNLADTHDPSLNDGEADKE